MNTPSPHPLTLVLGGARSGKSAFAEGLALTHSRAVYTATALGHSRAVYIATAQRIDDEMSQRIDAHVRRRDPALWRTVEAPLDLAAAIGAESAPGHALLVDCLSVWLGNLMHHNHDIDSARAALLESLAGAAGPVVLVANEVGLGVVPDNAQARAFCDHAGTLNQAVAALATRVLFIAAGLPMALKDTE